MRRLALALVTLVTACGDNAPEPVPPAPDCSAFAPPPGGWTVEGAREALRRSALRQRLRYREAVEPGYVLRETALAAPDDDVAAGTVCPQELAEVGRILFEQTIAAGIPFQRVQSDGGGPEAASCTACHWQRGTGGSSGLPDASFLFGDGDRITSGDARSAPSLAGAGVLEALAAEMTADLARLRDRAITRARRDDASITVELVSKGVSFGTLGVDARGDLDTASVRGVDPDLVVRPFGWKGSSARLVDVVASEAGAHLGITGELASGQVVALSAYIASLDVPVVRPHETPVNRAEPLGPLEPYLVDEWARGRVVFDEVGCGSCHVASLPLTDPVIRLRVDPSARGIAFDLSRNGEPPRLTADPLTGGYPVALFSDLKRHDLGDVNASQYLQGGVARRFYLTRPLWGLGVSAPYMHDGTAMTIDAAVARHGGEGAAARDAVTALSATDRSALRVFLTSLRRGQRLVVP